jgi:uncharacterized protein (TIGR04222 family)
VNRAWLRWRNRPQAESPQTPSPLADPYAVAYLRGGADEAVRTAVFALLYRGALKHLSKKNLRQARGFSAAGLHPLETQVLARFDTPRSAQGLLWESSWTRGITASYEASLRRAGLLNHRGALEARVHRFLVIALLVVAIIRTVVSVQMGYTGFPLLVGATLIGWFFLRPSKRAQTPLGRRALDQQKQAHQRWMHSAGNVDETTWVAAAFGVAALSAIAYPMAMYAMPIMGRRTGDGSGDSGSGMGTSGDSSTSSDGGWCSSDSSSGDSGSCGDGGGGSSSD